MAEWKRDDTDDVIALAAGVPDAVAVTDGAGVLVGWDDAAVCAYLGLHGLPGCGDVCRVRNHVTPL